MKSLSSLAKFEAAAQGLLEGAPAHLLRGQLQPVELAKRLTRAMEAERSIGVDKVYVPNLYRLHLHPEDYSTFEPHKESLERELTAYLLTAARERRLSFRYRLGVTVCSDAAVRRHGLLIETATEDAPLQEEAAPDAQFTAPLRLGDRAGATALRCALIFSMPSAPGRKVMVERFPFRLGRSLDNDLVLEDGRVSRHHAQIVELYGKPLLADLGSTNGSFLNGEAVTRAQLRDGDVISLGGVELLFELEG